MEVVVVAVEGTVAVAMKEEATPTLKATTMAGVATINIHGMHPIP
jgi:hypothetical protein